MGTTRNLKHNSECVSCGAIFHPWFGREQSSRFCSSKCNAAALSAARANDKSDFWRYVHKQEGCWEWTGYIGKNGYGTFQIGGRREAAHRFSYQCNVGPIPNGLFVCHSCDNRKCVNPTHLWLGTCGDNNIDMTQKGRNYRGPSKIHSEAHPKSKLTSADAIAIRSDQRNITEIARSFGVSRALIRGIKNGTHWKYA